MGGVRAGGYDCSHIREHQGPPSPGLHPPSLPERPVRAGQAGGSRGAAIPPGAPQPGWGTPSISGDMVGQDQAGNRLTPLRSSRLSGPSDPSTWVRLPAGAPPGEPSPGHGVPGWIGTPPTIWEPPVQGWWVALEWLYRPSPSRRQTRVCAAWVAQGAGGGDDRGAGGSALLLVKPRGRVGCGEAGRSGTRGPPTAPHGLREPVPVLIPIIYASGASPDPPPSVALPGQPGDPSIQGSPPRLLPRSRGSNPTK